ncbi:MAG TPA: Mur ligase family protein [Gemmatimonadales bacterium]
MAISVLDSRRLTGPGVLLDGPGAVIDVRLEDSVEQAIAAWRRSAGHLLEEVGWGNERLVSRRFPGGVSLAFTAPVDGLYAATELNERAWEAAAAELHGRPAPNLGADVAALRSAIASERNPALVAIRQAARDRGLTFLSGEELVSVGSGTGALVWPAQSLPEPGAVDWSRVHDVPIALVTGSNGKTTVVRLLAEMVRQAGRVPGFTSTEGVFAGSEPIGEGDFSGPSGARLVLRHPHVQTAILETARGGILRRGLAVERANVALVTNVAEDHLGEFGVETLAQLADTKLVVAKALGSGGTLVLNADDPMLVERHQQAAGPLTWFSLDASSPLVADHIQPGGTAVVADGEHLVLIRRGAPHPLVPLSDIPITFGGSAEHNIANALAATAVGDALGIEIEPMAAALRRFGRTAADNPGRANLIEVGGVRVLIDYVHNPHGMMALVRLVERLPGGRRLIMLGQAGDRGDEAIRHLARAAWSLRPDRVMIKDMAEYLRGRAPGEVPSLLSDEFTRLGVDDAAITRVGRDVEGVRQALAWARPGDLLIMAVHQDRSEIMALLGRLQAAEWRAGQALPAA